MVRLPRLVLQAAITANSAKADDAKLRGYSTQLGATPVEPPNESMEGLAFASSEQLIKAKYFDCFARAADVLRLHR